VSGESLECIPTGASVDEVHVLIEGKGNGIGFDKCLRMVGMSLHGEDSGILSIMKPP